MTHVGNLLPLSSPELPLPDTRIVEAHHRVANNLALVAGFVRMHARDFARRSEPASLEDIRILLEELSLRVEAIGQIHHRLSRIPGPEIVDLAPYLRDIGRSVMASLSFAGPTRLAFDSHGPCPLPAQSALLVGLVVSELLMNAIKYAHPTGVMGNVFVGCNRAGDAIIVDVVDDGVGFPEGFEPSTSGDIGLKLVRSLSQQLKASLRFHQSGIGVHVTLNVPAPSGTEVGI